MSNTRIFHVEDYKIMRDGVKLLLEQDSNLQVVGEAATGPDLLKALLTKQVDVLILDIYLDGMQDLSASNGFEICETVRRLYPDIFIIIHSAYDDADSIARVLRAGVNGFVSKKSGIIELIKAIKEVASGNRYICKESSERLKNLKEFLMGLENLKSKNEVFSQRERQVLGMLAEGKSSREIGETLCIGERTIESHRKNMIEKCNVKNTVELIAYASSLGLIKKIL